MSINYAGHYYFTLFNIAATDIEGGNFAQSNKIIPATLTTIHLKGAFISRSVDGGLDRIKSGIGFLWYDWQC